MAAASPGPPGVHRPVIAAREPRRWTESGSAAACRSTGAIPIGGAKNAALPLMTASLLTDETLSSQPARLADITTMAHLLVQHGVGIARGRRTARAERGARAGTCRPRTSPRPPRPTIWCARCAPRCWCWGRCVARCGEARVSLPGGCAIGTRPVDLHIKGLQRLGAKVELQRGLYRGARAERAARRRDRVSDRLGRRHREPDDGGDARRRRDRAGQCRARARDRRSRRAASRRWAPQIEGIGSDRLRIRGVGAAARRPATASSPTASRPAPT